MNWCTSTGMNKLIISAGWQSRRRLQAVVETSDQRNEWPAIKLLKVFIIDLEVHQAHHDQLVTYKNLALGLRVVTLGSEADLCTRIGCGNLSLESWNCFTCGRRVCDALTSSTRII